MRFVELVGNRGLTADSVPQITFIHNVLDSETDPTMIFAFYAYKHSTYIIKHFLPAP